MRYLVMTDVPPEEVLDRAKRFFAEHTRLRVSEETPDHLSLAGELGTARIRAYVDENWQFAQLAWLKVPAVHATGRFARLGPTNSVYHARHSSTSQVSRSAFPVEVCRPIMPFCSWQSSGRA